MTDLAKKRRENVSKLSTKPVKKCSAELEKKAK